jgi:hypothetical protein
VRKSTFEGSGELIVILILTAWHSRAGIDICSLDETHANGAELANGATSPERAILSRFIVGTLFT